MYPILVYFNIFPASFHISDVIGYHIKKAGTILPEIITNAKEEAALYILCMKVPTDTTTRTWTTETINVFGNTEEVDRLIANIDHKLKGKGNVIEIKPGMF